MNYFLNKMLDEAEERGVFKKAAEAIIDKKKGGKVTEYDRLLDFQCPKCGNVDEDVRVLGNTYREAIDKQDGWIWHTCSKCGCEFKTQE